MPRSERSDWNPEQYNRFASEREQPFWDLAGLVEPVADATVVDLGCGDGRLTAALHHRLGARRTLGVDNSRAMLAAAAEHAGADVDFEDGDIATWEGAGLDVVFSNAALHWVPDHAAVLARWRAALQAGGQLAVQMPTNASHASHRVASEVATDLLGQDAPPDPAAHNVLLPEHYAEVLDGLGFARQHVRLQVYVHHLQHSADVVEWVRGTTLNRFKPVFDSDGYEEFVNEYRRRLLAEIGERAPYLYTFKRVLLWGRLE